MKKISILDITRVVVQIIAFILIPGLFIDVFLGIGAIITGLISGSFTLEGYIFQIILVAVTLVVTAVLGRFFCGFLCSFGAMADGIWFIGRKLHLPEIKVPFKVERVLSKFKHLLLTFIVIFVWVLGIVTIEDDFNPWSVFGKYTRVEGFNDLTALISIGGVLLLIVIISSLFIQRAFCRFLCPLGGIFSIISIIRLTKVRKATKECGSCKLCTSKCPVNLQLGGMEYVNSGECINCLKCVDNCPRENACIKGTGSKYLALVVAIISIILIIGSYYGGIIAVNSESQVVAEVNDNVDTGKYKDGTYTGRGEGYRGSTTVRVTVEGGKIIQVEVTDTGDDYQYFSRAEGTVESEIIDSQDVNVDAVTGATFSSNGIMAAVADALDIEYANQNDTLERGHGGK